MAAAASFAIIEILEQVPSHLSFGKILRARQVSRAWKDVIESSHPLKQETYRAAKGIPFPSVGDLKALTRPPNSPLPPVISEGVVINPLFPLKPGVRDGSEPFLLNRDWRKREDKSESIRYTFVFSAARIFPDLENDFYRDMLLSQPPCTTLFLQLRSPLLPSIINIASLHDPHGITLALLLTTFMSMLMSVSFFDPRYNALPTTYHAVFELRAAENSGLFFP